MPLLTPYMASQVVGNVEVRLSWSAWPEPPLPTELVTVAFEQPGSLGLDLIFPFIKAITPGSLASSLGSLRPGLTLTRVGDMPTEYRSMEDAFAGALASVR
jgi:hypothetical protein